MEIEESVNKLIKIEEGFKDATTSLEQIFSDLKLTRDPAIPIENAISTTKIAASAAIFLEQEEMMRQAANPDRITVAVQLAINGGKTRIGLAGGAVLSDQE